MSDYLSKTLTNADVTILIIEDNPVNMSILLHVLMNADFNVIVADAGEPGVEMAQNDLPDIILLDIVLPGIDGFTVCEQLKQIEATEDIPIIFMTAMTETESIVRAFEMGAVDYITKPINSAEVLARINTHLTMSRLQSDLEHEVEERGRLIEELDAFAHMVAHDLKNPLGNIVGFAKVLEKGYGRLPERDISFALEALSDNAYKMGDIIDSLLTLARVRQSEVEIRSVHMEQVINESLKRLRPNVQSARATIDCAASWPEVQGYAPWLEEIWVNYISNALKYGGEPPKIYLGWDETSTGFYRFWVQDNGVGLTPSQQEQLFQPFVRFHVTKAEGHGLGLSIVQRIVLKFGGQVGVQSDSGAGCQFYFTLPNLEQPILSI